MKRLITLLTLAASALMCTPVIHARQDVLSTATAGQQKPRILVSTDIGGTDPDDNQSMAHLLMMNDCFDIEGLVSSPSFGNGSKEEIIRMIGLYELDYPALSKYAPTLLTADSLRSLCKQGRRGAAPWVGHDQPTEGSQWIVACARKASDRPLWVLVWGALEDVAQALHDAPDIASKIRVYWIGGPNKKWGVNAYSYIARNFPDLWFIENNASYRGFIDNSSNNDYYAEHIKDAGHLGRDFGNYYGGKIKMGDTPALLYVMNGNPEQPLQPKWGGQFEAMGRSPYRIFNGTTSAKDTIPVYGIFELQFPITRKMKKRGIPDVPFTLEIDKQQWRASLVGDACAVRYSPKAPGVLHYTISSEMPELNDQEGTIVVSEKWPGMTDTKTDIPLGRHWYTDLQSPALFQGVWQGAKTISAWRDEVLQDWAVRWNWLKDNDKALPYRHYDLEALPPMVIP